MLEGDCCRLLGCVGEMSTEDVNCVKDVLAR